MRTTLCLPFAVTVAALAATLGLAAASGEASAETYRYRGKTYVVTKRCDHDCVRARHLDPAGNYRAYPDWARAALSPKTDGRRGR
jgi:uncharacterized membrane protein